MTQPRHAFIYRRNRPDLAGSTPEGQQPDQPPAQDRALNIDQVRKRLNCSRSHVYNLIQAGVIDAFRIGSRNGLRVKESVVRQFIQEKEAQEEV